MQHALDIEKYGGFQEITGYHVSKWALGEAEISLTLDERHLNRSKIIHGGVFATIMDAAMGYACVYTGSPEVIKRVVTLSFTVNFIKSVDKGAIRAVATQTGGGKSIAFAECALYDDTGQLLAKASGTFKRISL
jgi:uncharacterized protein (TIGR00369 family)